MGNFRRIDRRTLRVPISLANEARGGAGLSAHTLEIPNRTLALTLKPFHALALDLNTGEHLWLVPNGAAPAAVRDHPDLQGLDFSKMGQNGRAGALVTKTLLFVGEGGGLRGGAKGAGGPMLRAYDKKTGDVIAEHKLPGGTTGVPMSYMADGKQYICVAIGAEDLPAELIALSLP